MPELCDDEFLDEQLHLRLRLPERGKLSLQNETFSYGSVKTKVKSIYREINEELDDFQKQYDEETNFSRNSAKQEEWIMKIDRALKKINSSILQHHGVRSYFSKKSVENCLFPRLHSRVFVFF